MKQTDDDLIVRIRQQLDENSEQLDPALAGRLRAARRTALQTRPKRLLRYGPVFAGGAALATVLLVSVYVGRGPQAPDTIESPLATVAQDMDIIAESDNLELFDDLEFYQWLVETSEYTG